MNMQRLWVPYCKYSSVTIHCAWSFCTFGWLSNSIRGVRLLYMDFRYFSIVKFLNKVVFRYYMLYINIDFACWLQKDWLTNYPRLSLTSRHCCSPNRNMSYYFLHAFFFNICIQLDSTVNLLSRANIRLDCLVFIGHLLLFCMLYHFKIRHLFACIQFIIYIYFLNIYVHVLFCYCKGDADNIEYKFTLCKLLPGLISIKLNKKSKLMHYEFFMIITSENLNQ